MRITIFAAASAAVLALATPVRAQDEPADTAGAPRTPLRKGAWSLSFEAPGYAAGERAQFGLWRMAGSRTNLGLALDLAVLDHDREADGEEVDDATRAVGLGLHARRYLGPERAVMPFVQGGVFGRTGSLRRESGDAEEERSTRQGGIEAGVGAEWFPVRQISVSGYTGARASASRTEQDSTTPGGDVSSTSNDLVLQTFTSALAVRIYF